MRGTTSVIVLLAIALAVNAGVILKTNYHGSLNRKDTFDAASQQQAGNEEVFVQKLDHFNPQEKRTFNQRYFYNDTFFNGNGPVFMILGGEGPNSPTSVGGRFVINNYAQELKALIVSVEHRHYGKSVPLGSLSAESLRFLSSQQALADFATIRQHIKQKFKVANSKWIAVGGSYSGNLAAWIRNKYPHLFDMAIATSAPVKAVVDFPEYMYVVQSSLGDSCASVVRKATNEMESLIKTNEGRDKLTAMFKVCGGIGRLDDDMSTFFSSLADPICGTVQYNLDNNSLGNLMNITTLCSYMKPENPLQSYADFINAYYAKTSQNCTLGTYDSYLKQLQDERPYPDNDNAAGRSWTYQTCTEFGYYQSAQGVEQPFSKYISLPWFLDQCNKLFGIKDVQSNVDWTNTYYGQTGIDATRTVFPNGSIDPWHVLGLLQSDKVDPNNILFMKGTAHCADLYAPRDSDLQTLTHTRSETLKQLKQWLA